jgi:hypothetical protein
MYSDFEGECETYPSFWWDHGADGAIGTKLKCEQGV